MMAHYIPRPQLGDKLSGLVEDQHQFSEADEYTYKYGPHANTVTTHAAGGYLTWNGDISAYLGNADAANHIIMQRFPVRAGEKSITAATIKGLITTYYATAVFLEIWEKLTSTYKRVASAEITSQVGTGAPQTVVTVDLSATPLEFTLEDGGEYYLALRLVRTTTVSTTPWLACTVETGFAHDCVNVGIVASYDMAANGWEFSSSNVTATIRYQASGLDHAACIEVTFASFEPSEITEDTNVVGYRNLIPRRVDTGLERTQIQLRQCVVTDTNALTVTLENMAADGQATATNVLELDSGDTTPSTNTITYDGNLVTLADIDPGGGSESQDGEPMDLNLLWDDTTADAFYQCTGLEKEIHSHAVKDSGTRGTRYTIAQPEYINIAGTATIEELIAGSPGCVVVADSQGISGSLSVNRFLNTTGWGAVPAELTRPLSAILHGQGGLMASQANEDIFANSTPGDGDGIELCGYGLTWFFCGLGVNDASTATTSNESDARKVAASVTMHHAAMMEQIADAGDRIFVMGPPPYSDTSPTADQYEASAVRRLSRGLAGICRAIGCGFYNSWPDMVEPGTEGEAIPTFLAAYTSDGGTHFSADGGTVARGYAIAVFEANGLDMRDFNFRI